MLKGICNYPVTAHHTSIYLVHIQLYTLIKHAEKENLLRSAEDLAHHFPFPGLRFCKPLTVTNESSV